MNPQRISLFDDAMLPGEYEVPADATTTACRSCGATIVWKRTVSGAAMPLSLKTARTVNGQRVATVHFADCPHGQQWQTRRRGPSS